MDSTNNGGVANDATPPDVNNPAVIKDSTTNYSGFETGQEAGAAANEAAKTTMAGAALKSLENGPIGSLLDASALEAQHLWGTFAKPDPTFNITDHKDLYEDLPAQYWPQFSSTRSVPEAAMLSQQIKSELSASNFAGHAYGSPFIGYALGGFLDPVNLAVFKGTGSLVEGAGLASKLGVVGGAVEGAASGAAGGAAGAAIQGSISHTGSWSDIPEAALDGAALGTVAGGFGLHGTASDFDDVVKPVNESFRNMREDFNNSVADGQTGNRQYGETQTTADTVFNTEAQVKESVDALEQKIVDLELKHDALQPGAEQEAIKAQMSDVSDRIISQKYGHGGSDSVGAASINNAQAPNVSDLTDAQKLMRDQATQFNAANGVTGMSQFAFPANAQGRAASKMYAAIQKTPFASDFDKLFNSNSPIGSALAFKLLESPIGLVRNNKSASALSDIYVTNVSRDVNVNYIKQYNKWMAEKKSAQTTIDGQNDPVTRAQFEREFHTEMQSRLHDGGSDPASTQAIKDYADMADMSSANAVNILKGREGEIPVNGSETLQPRSGYWPQRWSGAKLNALLAELKGQVADPKGMMERTLADQYMTLHGWTDEQAVKFSRQVMLRAISNEDAVATNARDILAQEGSEYMEKFLKNSGIDPADVDNMIQHLKNIKAESTKANFLKGRVDMDMRTPIPNTSKTLMDIMDTDITKVWTSYSRRVAGLSATARHGIQMSDWEPIFSAIRADEALNGGRTLSDDFFSGIKSYFSGGPMAGGINPWLRRITHLAHLSILNGLGLTQAAESGVNIAALGVKTFFRTARKEVQDMRSGKGDAQVLKDLSKWLSPIDGEHMILRDDLMLDSIRKEPGTYSELGHYMDGLLTKGARLQGYASGFFKIKQLQQRIAIRGMIQRLAEMYKDGKLISDARLEDMGLNASASARIAKYFKNGTIEYGPDGDIVALHPEKWNPSDFEDFVLALNRHTHQVVQKAMKGETSVWMHKDVGATFMDLKGFTILSMQKQLLRNARITDQVAMTSFIYGLATAAVALAAKNALGGNSKNNTPGKLALGAIGLANMTSIVPSITDPTMSMLGLDQYRMNQYGQYGQEGDIVPVPPMYSAINRMLKAPAATARIVTGTYDNKDVYAAQALPIVGNLTGLGYLWHQLRIDPKAVQTPIIPATKQAPTPAAAPTVSPVGNHPAAAKPVVVQAKAATPPAAKPAKGATAPQSETDKRANKVLKDLGAQ